LALFATGSIAGQEKACDNLGLDFTPEDTLFNVFPLSFLCVFIVFAVGSLIFHTDTPVEASRFLGVEHHSQLICDWLALKF
jgi:hypothetical protein